MADESNKILVTGGLGYLGHSAARWLRHQGYEPILLDVKAAPSWIDFESVQVDMADAKAFMDACLRLSQKHEIRSVWHFAALALVGESVDHPCSYFSNNILSTLHLLEAMGKNFPQAHLIYSSSCSIYGQPEQIPVDEQAPKHPISPYGQSKWMGEQLIEQYVKFKNLTATSLRYFNPAGAVDGLFGECHVPETHLIPRVLESIAAQNEIEVFGKDHPTPDGTCLRDFIHIEDLIRAHQNCMEMMARSQGPCHFKINVGASRGVSVLQVIKTCEKVTGQKAHIAWKPARPGDPPHLEAHTHYAKKLLQWEAKKNIEDIILSQWEWMKQPEYQKWMAWNHHQSQRLAQG